MRHTTTTTRILTQSASSVIRFSKNYSTDIFRRGGRELSSAAVAVNTTVPVLEELTLSSSLSRGPPPQKKRLDELRQRLKTDVPKLESFSSSSSKPKEEEEQNIYDILNRLPPLEFTHSNKNLLLTDRYQREHSYLRISLAERCNLRCQYCMPPEGVPLQPASDLLQRDEIVELATLFASFGVDKIRLTGGEPLLRKDLKEIIGELSAIPNITQIGMTTNGITLKRQLDGLVDAGLTHVNISLDTLKEDKFLHLTRRPGLKKVQAAIEAAALALPPNRVKINCVVMRNTNEDEIADFCRLTRHLPVDVRFIEWMPFFSNGWLENGLVPYREMLDIATSSSVQLERIQDGPNDTTKWWKLGDGDSVGRIGFITSMSDHFCGTCNRIRLTADGKIKVCLFGSTELSLRDALRDPNITKNDLQRLIHYAVQRKHFSLGGHGTPQDIADANNNRPMTLIGG